MRTHTLEKCMGRCIPVGMYGMHVRTTTFGPFEFPVCRPFSPSLYSSVSGRFEFPIIFEGTLTFQLSQY